MNWFYRILLGCIYFSEPLSVRINCFCSVWWTDISVTGVLNWFCKKHTPLEYQIIINYLVMIVILSLGNFTGIQVNRYSRYFLGSMVNVKYSTTVMWIIYYILFHLTKLIVVCSHTVLWWIQDYHKIGLKYPLGTAEDWILLFTNHRDEYI